MWSAMGSNRRQTVLSIVTLIALGASTLCAAAEDYSVGSIQFAQPWTRATPKGSSVAGAYMKISNKGTAADRLIGGTTDVAARFEVHRMNMENGVMTMRPVEGGLEIKPGATVELKPGSFHVMLIGLKKPLEKGQRVKATLEFANAGKVDVEYAVEAIGAGAPTTGHQH
jgi:periplasmic copper chaperone A